MNFLKDIKFKNYQIVAGLLIVLVLFYFLPVTIKTIWRGGDSAWDNAELFYLPINLLICSALFTGVMEFIPDGLRMLYRITYWVTLIFLLSGSTVLLYDNIGDMYDGGYRLSLRLLFFYEYTLIPNYIGIVPTLTFILLSTFLPKEKYLTTWNFICLILIICDLIYFIGWR